MTFDKLGEAHQVLTDARARAKAEAKAITQRITGPAQDALDAAVLAAVAEGATRTSVAAFLRESRTTINERLTRATGGATRSEVDAVVQTQAPLTYLIDGDKLHVDWRNYGPDHITDFGVVEIVYDADEEAYWFMSDGQDSNQVVQRLDTQFTGWYYHDAEQFVKNALNTGGTE